MKKTDILTLFICGLNFLAFLYFAIIGAVHDSPLYLGVGFLFFEMIGMYPAIDSLYALLNKMHGLLLSLDSSIDKVMLNKSIEGVKKNGKNTNSNR